MEKGIHIFFFLVSIVIIPTPLTLSRQANSSGAKFLSTYPSSWREWILLLLVYVRSQNMKLSIFTGSRAVDGKEMYKKSVMHVQSCCFALSSYCLFDFLVAAASLYSYYLRYIVMSQKQNILGANWIAPANSPPGGEGTAIYGLYRYVSLWRVWFSSSLL